MPDRISPSRAALFGVDLALLLATVWLGACRSSAPACNPSNTADFDAEAARLVEIMGLAPGHHVADVGAGKGEWTVPLAQTVQPGGRAWATEVKESKIKEIEKSLRRADLEDPSIRVVLGSDGASGLPEACCDAILLRRVYHHFIDPAAMGRDLFEALKPGGLLVVVDYSSYLSEPVTGVPANRTGHGQDPSIVLEETTAIGFQQVQLHEPWMGLENMYCLVLQRPPLE